jgi:eukaryotic-like serine/threonine-protein kinase
MSLSFNGLYRFDEFELDPSRRSLSRDGAVIPLSSKAFQVLTYLVANPGRVVTKDELLKAVWPESFVEESNLPGYISGLRKAFNDRASCIATVPGQGYQFTARVQTELLTHSSTERGSQNVQIQQMRESTHVIIRETSTPVLALAAPRPLQRRWVSWLPATTALILSAGATYAVWKYRHRVETPPLVVLSDFENATGDEHLDRVLDGALETDLRQSPYLSFLSNVTIQQTLTQMQRPKTAPFSTEVAREVCQRNNAQVLLHGVIARFGQRYLLTINAIDCQSGADLAQTKSEAATADDIPHAIDVVAADMRKRLGESRASIRQYDAPLFPAPTNSLEALQRFSEARSLASQGKYGQAISLYRQAIELDPKFATAYADVSSCYGNLGDHDSQVENLTKAYTLRDTVGTHDKLWITASYAEFVTGDLNESLRNYRAWTTIYPKDGVPWSSLANTYTQLGQAELAIDPGKRALELSPDDPVDFVVLARALMHAGKLDEAETICQRAIAKGLDGGDLHSILMEIAAARHDAAGIDAQLAWAQASPDPSRLKFNVALLAFAAGQARHGLELLNETADYYKQRGLERVGTRYLLAGTRMLAEEGRVAEAKKLLDTFPLIPGMTDPVVALAEVGEQDRAARILPQELSRRPRDTLWTSYRGPQIQAAILLADHKPQQALDALSHTVPLDYRNYDALLLRGEAYLAAQQPGLAEQEFRKILEHPGVDPFSYEYPLAHLGLARAYTMQNKPAESGREYEALFLLWKNADNDLPILKQARSEYTRLQE